MQIHQRFKSKRPFDVLVETALADRGIFTTAQAAALGISSQALGRAIKSGKITRVFPSVYAVIGVPVTVDSLLAAACMWCNGVASHRAAARLWNMDGCNFQDVELTVDRSVRCTRTDMIVHVGSLVRAEMTRVDGIPVTDPARTLLDLAGCVKPATLEIALEDCLRRGLTSLPRLKWQLHHSGGRGRRGSKALRRSLEIRGNQAPTESGLETKLAAWFRSTKLPPPVRQHRLMDQQGRVVARFDFAYPDRRLAVEGHSFRWHSGRHSWVRDLRKERAVSALGWKVIYAVSEDLAPNSDELERHIARELGIVLF